MEMNDLVADVIMLGTFSAWNLGTIQARTLPLAAELRSQGIRPAIVVTPWDMPSEAGVVDVIDGVPVINTRSASATNPLPAIRQQIAWARKLKPSLVHVFKPKGFGGFAGRVLSRSMPLIVDSDDWEGDGGWNDAGDYGPLQRRVFQYQEQDLLCRATYVTAASTLLAERAREIRNSAGDTVKRLPNGMTYKHWRELSSARLTPPASIDPPVILLYSRFAEFNNDWLASFVSALSVITDRKLIVRVVGDAENQSKPVLLGGKIIVEILGYVSWAAVSTLLGSSSVAVYPYRDSLVTRSKQSVKLLEQMAAGCPILASDVGDIASTLGTAGVVLPDASPERFARSTIELLEQPERMNVMSADGTERIRSAFLFEDLARDLLDVYGRVGLKQ
ncbi:glycosyltransferase family 4 protein [soil metagenome]